MKATIDERRVLLEENMVMADIIVKKNMMMMMDLSEMDMMSGELWEVRRIKVIQRKWHASRWWQCLN
jgi:hypothetical protein